MNTMRYLRSLIVFISAVGTAFSVEAQSYVTNNNDTGTPSYGSFISSNVDSINLGTGGLSIRIPFISKKGRGVPFTTGYQYDSKIWMVDRYQLTQPPPTLTHYAWQPNNVGGNWNFFSSSIGASLDWTEQVYTCTPNPDYLPPAQIGIRANFVITDWQGTKYQVPLRRIYDLYQANRCSDDIAGTGQNYVGESDSDQWHADITNLDWMSHLGAVIKAIGGELPGASDTNGNYCCGQNGNWTLDTLGRPVAGTHSTGNQNIFAYDYYDTNGNVQSFFVTMMTIQLSTSFPTTDCGTYCYFDNVTPGALLTVVQKISLPNGLSYTFSYDDPDNPGHTNPYGEVTKITLPTGGYIKYRYSTCACGDLGPNDPDYGPIALDSRRVIERRVSSDGSSEQIWTYAYSASGTTVTDPLGNVEVHGFININGKLVENSVEYRQGSSTALKRVDTVWGMDYGPAYIDQPYTELNDALQSVYMNPRKTRVTTTLLDTNQVTKSETDYNDCFTYQVFGNNFTGCRIAATEEREYDLGSGGPGALVRYIDFTYLHNSNSNYLNAHMWNRVTQKSTYDAGGNLKASTQFVYDSTGITATSGVPQHDYTNYSSSNTLRGNITQTKRWLSTTGTWITTTNYFNDLGNLIQTTDPNGNSTYFSYTDNFADGVNRNSQAYLTSVTYPTTGGVAHIEGKQYFWYTGLVAAQCGENAPTPGSCSNSYSPSASSPVSDYAKYSYDLLGRPLTVIHGDGGTTNFTFNEPANPSPSSPITVQASSAIDTSQNLVKSAIIDGLGRASQTQLNSDPQGVTYADTTFDALGRAATTSNPYRSTSEPTYGITSYLYDGLGRTTKVIPPDGSTSANNISTAYSGNSVTVTDQAGRQRRSFADGLGRLIEVDEPGGVAAPTPGSGSGTVNGSEQSAGGSGATSGSGSASSSGSEQSHAGSPATSGHATVTISGAEQNTDTGYWDYECVLWDDSGGCQRYDYVWVDTGIVWDSGGVSITVNGHTDSVGYAYNSGGANSIASALASAINGDGSSPVTASVSGAVITLSAKSSGAATNYSLSADSWTGDPTDFGGPSFSASTSGSALTGGTDAGPTVYDSGSAWVTVNGFQASASYGQGSSSSSVASAIAAVFNGNGSSPVTASASGTSITLTAKTTGSGTNYSLSSGSSTSQSGTFGSPSFSISASGGALTGGSDGTGPTYDNGSVWITVNGSQVSATYAQGSTISGLANSLATSINNNSGYPVTASVSSGTVTLNAKGTGSSTNYSLSSGSSTNLPGTFSSPSFSVSVSGGALTGGSDGTTGSLSTPAVTLYSYDVLNNLVQVVQKGGTTDSSQWRTRTFAYDSLSRLTSATNPESGTIGYTYDSDGNVLTKTDARGIVTTYGYDPLNRVTQKTYSDGTPTAFFAYDGGGGWGVTQPNTIGRLSEHWVGPACCATIGTIFGYDAMGRTTVNNQRLAIDGNSSHSITYSFDFVGDLLAYTNGEGITITQTYNAADRITQLTSSLVDSQHPGTIASGITYTPAGELSQLTFGNGLVETDAYNNRLQPTQIRTYNPSTGGDVLNMTYGFADGSGNNNGNLISWASSGQQVFMRSYSYDALNRLTAMSSPADPSGCLGLNWSYDAWGNRLTQNSAGGGSCVSPQTPALTNNRLANATYDAAGNVTWDGSHHYTYDAENRIRSMDSGATTYTYDAVGDRVEKNVGGTKTEYLYGSGGQVVAELNGSGGWMVGYVSAGGEMLAQYRDSTTYFAHKDHLGSTRVMTKVDKTVYDSIDYLPFGEQLAGGTGTTHKFTGKERDAESGLDDFGARYMTSTFGRFMSADSHEFSAAEDPQTWNLFTYTRNNPLKYVDPSGHSPHCPTCDMPIPEGEAGGVGSVFDDEFGEAGGTVPGEANAGSNTHTYLFLVTNRDGTHELEAVEATNAYDAMGAVLDAGNGDQGTKAQITHFVIVPDPSKTVTAHFPLNSFTQQEVWYKVFTTDSKGNPESKVYEHWVELKETVLSGKVDACTGGRRCIMNGVLIDTMRVLSTEEHSVRKRFFVDGKPTQIYDPATKKAYDFVDVKASYASDPKTKVAFQFNYGNDKPN